MLLLRFSQEVREVANEMLSIISEEAPSYIQPKNLTSFLEQVDAIVRIDKRVLEKIYTILRFGLRDPFYGHGMLKGSNVAKNFRERFATLDQKMNAKYPQQNKIDKRLQDRNGNPIKDDFKDNLF